MKLLLKLLILSVPISFLLMFFILLTEDKSYPGADYDTYNFPKFELETLTGEKIFNSRIEGNDLLLNVWASWCITCRVEHPYLMNLKRQGIPILGLNYKDEREDAIEWLNKYGNPYEDNIYDYKGSLALDLGVTGAPETFLIINGQVVAHYQGEVNEMVWNEVFVPAIEGEGLF
jgi:cytochrome c biogenesis protein CcmG/thiol:disulfide interchange protein DsbE|tara:strand:- start:1894 stop:2415 length:522 start_codon:yes stop_codon:yes gene_type:complete